jgi:MFS family permease
MTSLFAGNISDSLGRTRSIAIGALIFAIGATLEAVSVTLGMFIAARCVVGFGQGTYLATVVVYVCEIAPPRFRGPLATTVQLFITAGLCIGYFTCYGTVKIDSSLSWRFPLALQAGISMFLSLAAFFYLPQSPRWLTMKGRKEEASLAWDRLGVSSAEREKDQLQNGPLAMLEETENEVPLLPAKLSFSARLQLNLREMVTVFKKGPRYPLLMGTFVMTMQQLSGIDGVIYVSLTPKVTRSPI